MKKIFLTLFLTFVLTMNFSCTEFDFEESRNSYVNQLKTEYKENFNTTFGVQSIDYKDNNWGMNFINSPIIISQHITRAAQPNSNQWGTTDDNSKYIDWSKPVDITPSEREEVLAVFNQKGEKEYEPLIDIQDFFVQQVYCGPNGENMNELACTTDMIVKSWWPLEYEHTGIYKDDIINNFNSGKYNGNAEQGCMLMWFSSTKDFSFKTSQSGGQRWYKHWRMEKINGNYYVGFDHEAVRQAEANDNEEDLRDYIYNDWIIKIIPGKGESDVIEDISDRTPVKTRIMCEDLPSSNSDFDYNDLVFDIYFTEESNKLYANITLKAAGGTLPLYIGTHEVHSEFGHPNINENGEYVMINTKAPGGVDNVDDVNLKIELNGNKFTTIQDAINALDIHVIKNGVNKIPLRTEIGQPAEMIAVKTNCEWPIERQHIFDKYTNFRNWIVNPNYYSFWE